MNPQIPVPPAVSIIPLFEIFPDAAGHWCASRIDGLVCGTFTDRPGAERFARRECLKLSVVRTFGTIEGVD
jgi:hypothetical protein